MANKIPLIIELNDQLSRPAKKAKASLRDLERAGKAVTRAIGGYNRMAGKTTAHNRKIARSATSAARSMTKLGRVASGRFTKGMDSGKARNFSRELMGVARSYGRVETAARRATRSIKASTTAMRMAGRAAGAQKRAQRRNSTEGGTRRGGSASRGGMMAGLAGGVGMAATTAAVAGTAVGAGFGLAAKKTAEVSTEVQRLRVGMNMLTGSAEQGAIAFGMTDRTAKDLNIDLVEAGDSMRKLLAMQFKIGEADTFVRLGADLRAIGSTSEEVKRALMAISQIKSKGRLQAEEMLQLAEAGVSADLVYKELEKRLGKTRQEVLKIQAAGKIDQGMGLDAIKGAILKKVGQSEAGEAAKIFAQTTLAGSQQGFKAGQTRFWKDVGDTMGGPDAFGGIFRSLQRAMDSVSTSKLAGILTEVVSAIEGMIELGGEFFGGFIDGMAIGTDASGSFSGLVKDLGPLFNALGKVAGLALRGIVLGVQLIGAGFAQLTKTVEGAADMIFEFFDRPWSEIGMDIIKGIISGVGSMMSPLTNAIGGIVDTIVDTFTGGDGLDINSPSKVFEGYGKDTVDGYRKGLEDNDGDIRYPTQGLADSAKNGTVAGAAQASTQRSSYAVTVAPQIKVDGASSPEATARTIKRMVVTELGGALERIALESGGAAA